MLERCEDPLLLPETPGERRWRCATPDDLDRDLARVRTIRAHGDIHVAHTAAPEQAHHFVGAKACARFQCGIRGGDERTGELQQRVRRLPDGGLGALDRVEQRGDLALEERIAAARPREERAPTVRLLRHRGREELIYLRPPARGSVRHQSSPG